MPAAVFVDATLPHPGVSWFDDAPAALVERLRGLVVDGWLPPWHRWFPAGALPALLPDERTRADFVAEVPVLPLAFFDEPAPASRTWPLERCAYLRLSQGYEREAHEAQRRGWPTLREPAHHLAMLTQPRRIASLLDRAVTDLLEPGGEP